MTDGVLVIDKPSGMTSHDVVDRVRKVFRTKKVGHAGTLDPDATGVLVIGLGRATRVLSYAQAGPKSYRAKAKLGVTTTTLDASGEVVQERRVDVTPAQLDAAVSAFTGEIEQVPPMVSAVKIEGERLYKKARRGEEVDRPPRRVTIFDLKVIDLDPPLLDVEVRCSAGTYIRSLVADIGEHLGCGAHLVSLRRTTAAGFTDAEAVPLDRLETGDLRPVADALRDLQMFEIDAEQAKRVGHGQHIQVPEGLDLDQGEPLALVSNGDLLAVYKRKEDALIADRVLAAD